MIVVLFVGNLMDQTQLNSAFADARIGREADDAAGADMVIVDLVRFGAAVTSIRAAAPTARIVCFGPHVDKSQLEAARAAGADVAIPRSRFFRNPLAAVDGS